MKKRKASTSKIIVSLLFLIYAICIMIVLITGANVYKKIHDRDTAAYNSRIINQYIVTHIRQSNSLTIEDFGEGQALVLQDHKEGYITKIYSYEGYLMELFTSVESTLPASAGTRIAESDTFSINLESNLLRISTDESEDLVISIK